MTTIINVKIGVSRKVARIWLEGRKLSHAGVEIGTKYVVKPDAVAKRLELIAVPFDFSGEDITATHRERNGIIHPVIDFRNRKIREVFEDDDKVRVAIRRGRIVITALKIQTKIRERLKRVREKLERGESLSVTSLFHGGGVLDKALHSGLLKAGVNSYVMCGVEMDSEYLSASLRNNPEIWREDSVVICSDIRDVDLSDQTPQSDIITGGIPCTGASRAGVAKNKNEYAEDHVTAGTLFFDFLQFVKVMNPLVCVIENVVEYMKTSSMSVIRSYLSSLGYVLHEAVLNGNDFGVLESRKRMVVVALTPGMGDLFSFDNLVPLRQKEACLKDVLEDFEKVEDRFNKYEYLALKAESDKAAGKGFSRQLLTGNEPSCGTIGRHYNKAQSTPPYIIHPNDPSLSRLLTPTEHARVKGNPVELIHGISDTTAHEVLGQGVCGPIFQSLGAEIGESLLRSLHDEDQPIRRAQVPFIPRIVHTQTNEPIEPVTQTPPGGVQHPQQGTLAMLF